MFEVFFHAILQISHLSFVPFHYTSSLSSTSFFHCSLHKTTLLPLWLHLLPFWVCFYIFYCCLSRAKFASSVCSAVCREKQCNKIFSVLALSPHFATCDHLLSNPWRHSPLNLCCGKENKRYMEEILRRLANCRDLWQAISTVSKLGRKQQEGGLGNAGNPTLRPNTAC